MLNMRPGAPSVLVVAAIVCFCTACATWELRRSVIKGDLPATKKMEGTRMSPESPDECGWTLLHYATYYQHTPIVEYLIGRSVNINARTTQHSGHCMAYSHIAANSTALIIAAYYGQADIICVLLAHGADTTAKDADGYDALTYARKFDFSESVRALEGTASCRR